MSNFPTSLQVFCDEEVLASNREKTKLLFPINPFKLPFFLLGIVVLWVLICISNCMLFFLEDIHKAFTPVLEK